MSWLMLMMTRPLTHGRPAVTGKVTALLGYLKVRIAAQRLVLSDGRSDQFWIWCVGSAPLMSVICEGYSVFSFHAANLLKIYWTSETRCWKFSSTQTKCFKSLIRGCHSRVDHSVEVVDLKVFQSLVHQEPHSWNVSHCFSVSSLSEQPSHSFLDKYFWLLFGPQRIQLPGTWWGRPLHLRLNSLLYPAALRRTGGACCMSVSISQ